MIGAATPWHQDEAFQDPANEYHELSFWLALQPTDRSNSCMEFIPQSHHRPVLPHWFPGDDPRVHALECVSGFDPAEAVPCALPAGGCTIHTQRTLHYAGPNASANPRLAYVLIFDLVPTPATEARVFPWREAHRTARAQREQAWRRRGGILVHLWRQRSRVRVTTLLFDLRRAMKAIRRLNRRV
jgi:ectoine hydroxylase-related dioxygenase (phytanoyl-CoA dioxygenase family)